MLRRKGAWTDEELATLAEMVGQKKSAVAIAARLGRTSAAVRSRACQEGFTVSLRPHVKRKPAESGPHDTAAHLAEAPPN